MDLGNKIGLSVREMRKARKLTQARLAEMTARTEDTISQIERGVSVPSIETLVAVCEALDVTLDTIVTISTLDDHTDEHSVLFRKAVAILTKLQTAELKVAILQIEALSSLNKKY